MADFEKLTLADLEALEAAAAHDPAAATELARAKLEINKLMTQLEGQGPATPSRSQVLARWLGMLDSTLSELRSTEGETHDASSLLSRLLRERALGTSAHIGRIGPEWVSLDPEERIELLDDHELGRSN